MTTTSTTTCGSGSRTSSGTELEDEDYDDGADGVLLWFRDGDDDLVDLWSTA